LNDLVAQAFAVAGVVKEPSGLLRQDSKRPDGLTLIPFEGGRALTWDMTIICSTANSYIDLAVQGLGLVAKLAASRKQAKYVDLWSLYSFQPIAVETPSPVNESACALLAFPFFLSFFNFFLTLVFTSKKIIITLLLLLFGG